MFDRLHQGDGVGGLFHAEKIKKIRERAGGGGQLAKGGHPHLHLTA